MKTTLYICLFFLFSWNIQSQTQSPRIFMFGHSLLVHEFTENPPPSDELTVPHWMYLLAQAAGNDLAVSGQYGFLPQHANLPPFAQWGFDIVPPAWDSDDEPFTAANFSHALITAGNFVQWQDPNEPYFGEPEFITPVSATVEISDWLREQESDLKIYIYENWPDMAGFIAGEGFPPNTSELSNYHEYTLGDFHDWWIEYQDALLEERPDFETRMIPVGPILSRLFTETELEGIPVLELYEDNAPHGRPTTYFLAGLITYMAMYQEVASMDFEVPNIVHSLVRDNYETVVNFIWNELEEFRDSEGNSRVFLQEGTNIGGASLAENQIRIFPNPMESHINIEANTAEKWEVQLLDYTGKTIVNDRLDSGILQLEVSHLPQGIYFLKIGNLVQKIIK